MKKEALMSVSSKFAKWHKHLYALPAFALALPTIPLFILLPTFYAETVGLGLGTVGAVLLIVRIFDVASDPIIGYVTDRIPLKYGRRKLPIALGGAIAAPALIFLLSPEATATAWYLGIWGCVLYLGWTSIQIPYLAWSTELSRNYHDRNKINGLREATGLIGILALSIILILLADSNEFDRFKTLSQITIGVGGILLTVTLLNVPETPRSGHPPALTFPAKNFLFLRVLSGWFLNGLANGFPAVCLPLYLTFILQCTETEKYLLIFIYFLCAIISIPFWIISARNIDKHKVWCYSMVLACAAFIFVPFLTAGDVIFFGVVCGVTGFALGSDLALPPSIQGDCADWDHYRFGYSRTATLFSYWSMSTKLSLGLAVGIAFPLLELYGLSLKSSPKNLESGFTALIIIYSIVPILLKVTAIWLMWGFPLTRHAHTAIHSALEKRKNL